MKPSGTLAGAWRALRLRARAVRFLLEMRRRGARARVVNQFRSRPMAHRFSTAHELFHGRIPMSALRGLTGGRDHDGHLWYRPDWDTGLPDGAPASECPLIRENARRLAARDVSYAEEGYPPGHRARAPNGDAVPVSRHVGGQAIDLEVDWRALGGPTGPEACAIVARCGLCRPVSGEHWHFELSPPA